MPLKIENGLAHPLMEAINKFAQLKELLKLIKKHPEDINRPDSLGTYPLMLAIPYFAQKKGYFPKLFQALLNAGANVNQRESGGSVPLHAACINNHLGVVKMLLSNGAELEVRDSNWHTPIMEFVGYHSKEWTLPIMQELIRYGADINAVDRQGCTALYIALDTGYANSSMSYLEAGADPTIKDRVYNKDCFDIFQENINMFPKEYLPKILDKLNESAKNVKHNKNINTILKTNPDYIFSI